MKELIVSTIYGAVKGRREGQVNVWRGIPFAQPPLGELRFRAPQPPRAWEGVREAAEFGPVCHQPPDTRGTRFGPEGARHDEDCLYLNVWAPAGGEAKRPVMVWIHGGTFVTGAGSQLMFEGANLAGNGDVVVVTVNYRLGPLGFLHLAPLGGGRVSNAGLLDQTLALEWVRDNIAAFGGDPGRVTVFGESAGSMSIAALMAMPAARGLFTGAIMQSGAGQALPPEQGEAVMRAMLTELGGEEALEAASAEAVMEAAARMTQRLSGGSLSMFFQPVLDPATLPVHPDEAAASGSASGVRLMIGTNREEGNLFFREGSTAAGNYEQSLQALAMLTGIGNLPELVKDYPASWQGQSQILTDLYFWRSSVAFAENQSRHAPVYMYRFDWSIPGHPLLGSAVHGAEIVYAFDNLEHLKRLGLEITPHMKGLAAAMRNAWASFAHKGTPSTAEYPWPRYTPEQRSTMILDGELRVEHDPEHEKRKRLFGHTGS